MGWDGLDIINYLTANGSLPAGSDNTVTTKLHNSNGHILPTINTITILDLFTPYTHNSELQVVTAPPLLSTNHPSAC
jgi:hypothetical protein